MLERIRGRASEGLQTLIGPRDPSPREPAGAFNPRHMPTTYGAEFRQDVIDVARKGEAPLAQIAKDFGLWVTTLKRWIAIAER